MTELEELDMRLTNHINKSQLDYQLQTARHRAIMAKLDKAIVCLDGLCIEVKKISVETKGVRNFWSDMTGAARFSNRLGKLALTVGKFGFIFTGLKLGFDAMIEYFSKQPMP